VGILGHPLIEITEGGVLGHPLIEIRPGFSLALNQAAIVLSGRGPVKDAMV